MAPQIEYTVKRRHWAKSKVDGAPVWLTPENASQIPDLLTVTDIRERVKSGALEEYAFDDGVLEVVEDETGPEVEDTASPRSTKRRTAKES